MPILLSALENVDHIQRVVLEYIAVKLRGYATIGVRIQEAQELEEDLRPTGSWMRTGEIRENGREGNETQTSYGAGAGCTERYRSRTPQGIAQQEIVDAGERIGRVPARSTAAVNAPSETVYESARDCFVPSEVASGAVARGAGVVLRRYQAGIHRHGKTKAETIAGTRAGPDGGEKLFMTGVRQLLPSPQCRKESEAAGMRAAHRIQAGSVDAGGAREAVGGSCQEREEEGVVWFEGWRQTGSRSRLAEILQTKRRKRGSSHCTSTFPLAHMNNT
ncbi:hypothetical protein B0H17DRAFT_1289796 [Mycena rosella]|uniref:Uncharacterized protein n=1 Tax=Mycena rosella TaxID=1033263 RepID=A0AAD7BJ77_MYCRO|nr:hypothetical protein B0H17DRAFT_1289796 [Mycena rosella]